MKSRTSESREVHHVTFAEECNKYVNSDSGIVLSPDDDYDGLQDLDDDNDDVERAFWPTASGGWNSQSVPGPSIIKLKRSHR